MAEEKKKFYKELEDLPGIGEVTAEKLREGGYTNFSTIAAAMPGDLTEIAGIGIEAAKKAIQAAKSMVEIGFETADQVYERRKSIGRITTSAKSLDELLGGGVETQAITEAYAKFSSGKSQLGFQLSVNVQKPPEEGGLGGGVLFIDTEHTFRPDRIAQIAEAAKMDVDAVLKNITIARAENSDHQIILTERADEIITEKNIRLIVIDSLTSHFRADYMGRGTLGERQQKLNAHVHTLQRLAEKFNLAVYITNQVMDNPGILFGDPTKPIGGHVLAHACLPGDTLIQLGNGEIKQIKELGMADEVVSANKELKIKKNRFTDKIIKTGINEIIEIDSGHKIKASPLHKFFILDDFEIKEIRAGDIKKGDYLMHADNLQFEGKVQQLPEIEQEQLVRVKPKGVSKLREMLLESNQNRTELCEEVGVSQRQLRRVLNQGYPTTEKNVGLLGAALDENVEECFEPHFTNKHRNMSMPSEMSIGLSQIYGYFLGDGNLDKFSLRFRDQRKEVLEIYNKLLQQEFMLEGIITKIKNKNCHNLNYNSKVIRDLFANMKKSIFSTISQSPQTHVAGFIKGFVDAEGYVSKSRPRIQIGQKNEQMLIFVQMLLLRFGIHARILKNGKCFTLLVDGKNMIEYAKKIGMSAEDKTKRLEKWCKHYESTFTREPIPVTRESARELLKMHNLPISMVPIKEKSYRNVNMSEAKELIRVFNEKGIVCKEIKFLQTLLAGDVRFEYVRSVKKMKNDEPLFDITVPVHENFVVNGFVAHNSTYRLYLRKGKDEKRIARLVDSPNLPEGECVFRVTSEGLCD